MKHGCKKFAREDAVSLDLWFLQQITIVIRLKQQNPLFYPYAQYAPNTDD